MCVCSDYNHYLAPHEISSDLCSSDLYFINSLVALFKSLFGVMLLTGGGGSIGSLT